MTRQVADTQTPRQKTLARPRCRAVRVSHVTTDARWVRARTLLTDLLTSLLTSLWTRSSVRSGRPTTRRRCRHCPTVAR
jgi:hypothetical protein